MVGVKWRLLFQFCFESTLGRDNGDTATLDMGLFGDPDPSQVVKSVTWAGFGPRDCI